MIKAIIFDADGVLITSKVFSQELEKDYGISTVKTLPFFETTFQKCLVGEADLKAEIIKYLDDWGWKGSVDELLDYWFGLKQIINEPLLKEVQLYKEKGIRCFVATNQEKYRTEYLIKHFHFSKLFDAVFSSAYLGYKKPQQAFFDAIMQKIPEYNPEEVVLWDDSVENVAAAKAYGLHAYFYSSLKQFKDTMNTLILSYKN